MNGPGRRKTIQPCSYLKGTSIPGIGPHAVTLDIRGAVMAPDQRRTGSPIVSRSTGPAQNALSIIRPPTASSRRIAAPIGRPIIAPRTVQPDTVGDRVMGCPPAGSTRHSSPVMCGAGRCVPLANTAWASRFTASLDDKIEPAHESLQQPADHTAVRAEPLLPFPTYRRPDAIGQRRDLPRSGSNSSVLGENWRSVRVITPNGVLMRIQ